MLEAEKKYNILYVNPFCQQISGADESLILTIKGLDKNSYNPIVVLPGASPYKEKYEKVGARVLTLKFGRIKRSLNPFYLIKLVFSFFPEVIRFRQLLKKENIAIVHNNMEVVLSSGLAAKLCSVKSIYHYRHNASDRPKIIYDIFINLLDKVSDHIIAISKATADTFYKRGISEEKVSVVYDFVDSKWYAGEKRKDFYESHFGLPQGTKVVATVGRINPRKNLEDFIRMAAIVRSKYAETYFFIIGDAHFGYENKYKDRLIALIRELGLQQSVILAGRQSEIPYIMNSSFLVTLSSHNEGYGRVLIEAMIMGKPLVGSNSGAIPELIEWGGAGVVYPVGNQQAFADATLKILSDKNLAAKYGESGKSKVMHELERDYQNVEIQKIYEKMLR
jgi:L-malate glycosyltransferase